jgi:radical SAM protein with 4Fe4S-binding SPASM domain
MIDCTRLLCGKIGHSEALRYGGATGRSPGHALRLGRDRKPIVVWNSTPSCNLRCVHCYYSAEMENNQEMLSTAEAQAMIDGLVAFGVPVLLFSGGEPLLRADLFELGAYARACGLRTVISTNGTLIDQAVAGRIRDAGFSYVGISLDGMAEVNDRFRGVSGAFERALQGIRHCTEAGVKAGLRLTLNQHNFRDLPDILDLLEREHIRRACFYHLVYAGRGRTLRDEDLTPAQTRQAVDLLFARSEDVCRRGVDIEILTVDNHADAPYLYRRVRERQPERADEVLELLRRNGGNASGIGIAAVDHHGDVHADQFWQSHTFGNVRERPFGDIWLDMSDPLMAGLKDRWSLLKGRCGQCQYLDLCNGNFRVRAEAVYGDVWAPDPACYLTDEEIGLA